MGAEIVPGETIPAETGITDVAVSFTKGCYVGQENTARMNWRQKVNRRLVVVPLDRSDPARRRAQHRSTRHQPDRAARHIQAGTPPGSTSTRQS